MASKSTQGTLNAKPLRSDGKQVDEWTFYTSRPAKDGGVKIVVNVSLVSEGQKLSFRTKIDGLGTIEDPNIQTLREKVEQALSKHAADNLGCVWEDWLKVNINLQPFEEARSDLSCGMAVQVERIKYGIDPVTGRAFILDGHWARLVKTAAEIEADDAKIFKGQTGPAIRLTEKESVSYVPATPSNLAAIEDLRQRVQMLRQRLIDALSQEKIMSTLADLSLPLLKSQ